jgi:hypothetical protein
MEASPLSSRRSTSPHAGLRRPRPLQFARLALLLCTTILVPTAAAAGYRLEHSTTLAGSLPGWDYLAFDSSRQYLFISRRAAGAVVFDVRQQKVVAVMPDAHGANAFSLIPELNLGYIANQDGSATKFDLQALMPLGRFKFGLDCDSVIFDPTTQQLVFTMSDSGAIAFADARAGKHTGSLSLPSKKLEAMVVDRSGQLFLADQEHHRLFRIDLRQRKITATWDTKDCKQPTGLAIDLEGRRLFVGCRGMGAMPLLAVVDQGSGEVLNTYPIGRGNDGVAYDAASKRIFTLNGVDANMVIYDQVGPSEFKLAEAVTTRPFARTIAYDPISKKVYSVAGQGSYDPAKPTRKDISPFYPNTYLKDTLAVLTYAIK